jgi:hypothetical protein
MIHPDVGDELNFKPMYEDNFIKGTVDWVGSAQFAITSSDNPAFREMILFSEDDRWKFINKKPPKSRTAKQTEEPDDLELEQETDNED